MLCFTRKENLMVMPSITSLHFDTTGWQAIRQSAQQIIWKNQGAGDVLSIEFFANRTELPFDLHDLGAIKAHHEQYSIKPNEGAIVSVDLISLHGLDVLRMIIKARNPQIAGFSPLGMTYLGSLMIPLADFSYVVKTQCFERGTTGMREAGVALTLYPQSSGHAGEAKAVDSVEEMFADMSKKPVILTPADDERYDAMFPQHPLSRARTYLKHIEETMTMEPEVQTARRIETRSS
jgi:hypothetical protein